MKETLVTRTIKFTKVTTLGVMKSRVRQRTELCNSWDNFGTREGIKNVHQV